MALKKMGLVTASALCSINLWTGAPLFAIWVGSKVQGSFNTLGMTAVFSVVAILAITVFGLGYVLTWLNAKYDELTGRPAAARQSSPWLRSMRDERDDTIQRKYGIGGVERVVVICAVAGVLAFELWFFFFAGSSLPNQ
jgi:Na+-transporting methylmalonyl-CoA/oxaloacetate decarboxylase gamma subunit